MRLLVAIGTLLIAAMFLTSCPACATLDAPKDNLDASPAQLVAAAKYRQAAFDRVAATTFAAAYLHTPSAACAALSTAAKLSDANRAKIDAANDALLDDDAAASADWGTIIDLVFTGIETTQVVTEAEANAKAVLRAGIPAKELQSRFERATSNYEAAAHMLLQVREKCSGA